MDSQLLVHFVVIGTGLLLGRVKLVGISLGSSGVIFSALVVGYLGYSIPGGIGTVGLVLFAYGVGITAGPGFFRGFRE
jgi:putative transport protein